MRRCKKEGEGEREGEWIGVWQACLCYEIVSRPGRIKKRKYFCFKIFHKNFWWWKNVDFCLPVWERKRGYDLYILLCIREGRERAALLKNEISKRKIKRFFPCFWLFFFRLKIVSFFIMREKGKDKESKNWERKQTMNLREKERMSKRERKHVYQRIYFICEGSGLSHCFLVK